jgi:hypothetical protein
MIHSVRSWKLLDFVRFFLLIFAMVIFPALCGCESQSQKVPGETPPGDTLDAAARREVLTQVAVTIRDHYADRDVGNSIADMILARLEQSRFDFPVDMDWDSIDESGRWTGMIVSTETENVQ